MGKYPYPAPKERCENCKYYELKNPDVGDERDHCHRVPPQMDDGRSHFPHVNKYDWCGEWKPREELK